MLIDQPPEPQQDEGSILEIDTDELTEPGPPIATDEKK